MATLFQDLRYALPTLARNPGYTAVLQAMRLAALGLGIGLVAAFAVTRLMRGILFDVAAADPVVYAAIALLLAAVAALAGFIPARRATRAEPAAALRDE